MKKSILALAVTTASLLASNAFATDAQCSIEGYVMKGTTQECVVNLADDACSTAKSNPEASADVTSACEKKAE